MYASAGELPALMFYAGLDEIHQRKVREAAPVEAGERDVLVHAKGGVGGLLIEIRCEPDFKEAGNVNLSVSAKLMDWTCQWKYL